MILKQLTLTNIRSYTQETIIFPHGSILLSGDIGAGKSTLLLAIEFALFGSSRPELPAESLLKKGTTKGMVELHFTLDSQEIIIQRNLKKENDSIKQAAGHLIINNLKKELTPVELKAAVITLLGYPEDLAAKNKNYIFRYTVYTPQESMKLILHEDADVRQDVLRRIFNIDKYKIIRENLQLYLRQMRITIAILSGNIEPLEEHKGSLEKIRQEKQNLQQSLDVIQQKLKVFCVHREQLQKEIDVLEQQQQQFQELKKQEEKTLVLIKEKKEQLLHQEQKEELITLTIAYLVIPPGISLEKVKAEIKAIELERSKLITQKTTMEQKVQLLQTKIQEDKQDIVILERSTAFIKCKEEEMAILKKETDPKNELLQKKKKLEIMMEEMFIIIAKNKTLSEHAEETQRKIHRLDNCPTCLQTVSESHKQKITADQQQKINTARLIAEGLEQKKADATAQKKIIETELEDITTREKKVIVLEMELKNLYQSQQKLRQKHENIKCNIEENSTLMVQLTEVQEQEKKFLNYDKIKELQISWDAINQKLFLEQQAQELLVQISENRNTQSLLDTKMREINFKLKDKQDCSEIIAGQKKNSNQMRDQERETAVAAASMQTNFYHLMIKEKELRDIVEELKAKKEKAVQLKELYHWLENIFCPLTNTIEKQIMVNIHHSFSQLFQEWFSIIIDDDTMSAQIDDSFTPIIEQNGYEISFNNLSGGEKTSAALAYRLALNRVINDVIHSIKTKDLLILDEPTDGFSTEQLDKIRDVLDRLQLQQMIIVSHESKIESFVENVIRIQKEGHVSKVIT